jgi:putative ribosome biogenesis GTPase RsgA
MSSIQDIVAQLKRLKIKETELLERLERLSDSHTSEPREFVIGDRVRIKNPQRSQARSGTIVRIGERVTVLTKDGTKIIRAPSNIEHAN